MNCLRAWMLPVFSIATLVVGSQDLLGQGPPPGMGPMPPSVMAGGPGMGPGMAPGMDPGMMGGGMMGGDMSCPPGYGDGYGGRAGHNGLLGDCLGIIMPYPDGGCAAPRWYDFEIGVISLTREDAGFVMPFASQGVGAGTIVLDTGDLDFDESTSFKFSAMMQWGPGSNLEYTFFGLFGWTESASFNDPTNLLFSPYSQFGNNPLGGFVETDAAYQATINYYSTFDSHEINFRQRWQSPNCRYQGSWLVGCRYFQLDEDFNYTTRVANVAAADTVVTTNVNTNNCMTGIQVGGDLWICLLPGLRVGGEGKFAVLGNHANIDNTINVTGVANPLTFADGTVVGDVSFLGDVAAYATYRINYNWTAKLGYQLIYLEGAALAPENFNAGPPLIFTPAAPPAPGDPPIPVRQGLARENGNVFYHGFTATLEYMW